ncbi:unnamed protein product [Soboliphyme baturini]|uniref:Kinesin motor domain-containing protein n=1 Tax=Soboliphyme baturini TaxID=241478 RepID=A0A183IU17_9BILA|nr:unnamed protein product [Soboliphyme baturini]
MSLAECVRVVVRTRPLNQREVNMGCDTVVDIDQGRAQCVIVNPNDRASLPKLFTFDGAYDSQATTETIYYEIVYPLVEVSTVCE